MSKAKVIAISTITTDFSSNIPEEVIKEMGLVMGDCIKWIYKNGIVIISLTTKKQKEKFDKKQFKDVIDRERQIKED